MTYTINICKPRPSCKSRLTGKCERVHKTICIRDADRLPLVRENIDLTGKCERVHKTICIRDDERLPLVWQNIDYLVNAKEFIRLHV